MKKILCAAVVASTLAVSPVRADSHAFSGFSVAANLNFISTSAEVHNGVFSGSIGDTDAMFSTQAGYVWELGGRYFLGVSGAHGFGFIKAGSAGTKAFKVEDIYGVHVEPGYLLNPTSLLYAKVGYLRMRAQAEASTGIEAKDFRGVGYGAGLRILLHSRWYLEMEILQTEYNELRLLDATYNPSTTTASAGLGWRF